MKIISSSWLGEGIVVCGCLFAVHFVKINHGSNGYFTGGFIQHQGGHKNRGRVEVQQVFGIDQDQAAAVRLHAQMDTAFLHFRLLKLEVVYARGRWR